MNRSRALLSMLALVLVVASLSAQDVAVVNSKTIKVKLDNDRVRVLEATLPPGWKEQMHSHPANFYYVIDGGRIRSHGADGKVTETTLQAGDTIARDPLTHWSENIGTTTIRLVLVELKNPKR